MTVRTFVVPRRIKKIKSFSDLENNYVFREDRPMKWLQKVCIWILKKLECFDVLTTVDYEVMNWSDDVQRDVWKFIREQIKQNQSLYYENPKKIFMGPEQFSELTDNPIVYTMFNVKLCTVEPYGVPIQVIPWMDGVLVV